MNTVLMHTCCAPCSLSCIDPLRAEGLEPVAFWYNPNIHPWKEYQARRDCLLEYAPTIGMEVRVREDYGLRDFVRHVAADIDRRCVYCYEHRLKGTAQYAAEHGFAAFTTTLLASLYQTTMESPALRSGMPENTASPSSIGTSGPISAPEISWPGKRGFICRSTAAAFSQSRTATKSRLTGIAPGFRRGDPPQPGGRQNVFLFPGTGL